jgi:hypothetical protein
MPPVNMYAVELQSAEGNQPRANYFTYLWPHADIFRKLVHVRSLLALSIPKWYHPTQLQTGQDLLRANL